MKKAMLTTIMAIAVTGLLALGASPAMADVIYFGSSPDEGLNIDSERMQDLMSAVNADAVDDDGVLVDPEPETYPDDGGGEGYDSSADAPPVDDGGVDEPVLPQNPGSNDGYDNPGSSGNPGTPETPKPPQTETKLPNTGTQMALIAVAGLVVIAAAYAVRRATARRSR